MNNTKKKERPVSEETGQLAADNSKGKVTKGNLQLEDKLVNKGGAQCF